MSNHRTIDEARIADLCKALSSPHRVRILSTLLSCCGSACATDEEFNACVGDIAEGLGVAPSTVSHHVKELRLAGLIQCNRNGQRIECCVDPAVLNLLHEFTTQLTQQAANSPVCICKEPSP